MLHTETKLFKTVQVIDMNYQQHMNLGMFKIQLDNSQYFPSLSRISPHKLPSFLGIYDEEIERNEKENKIETITRGKNWKIIWDGIWRQTEKKTGRDED